MLLLSFFLHQGGLTSARLIVAPALRYWLVQAQCSFTSAAMEYRYVTFTSAAVEYRYVTFTSAAMEYQYVLCDCLVGRSNTTECQLFAITTQPEAIIQHANLN